MNAWEGQVLAIAVKELLEAFKTLGHDGFGRKDRKVLSSVIQDLLTVNPNITRAEAMLKAYEALGGKPSPDLYVAKRLLEANQKKVPGRPLSPLGSTPARPSNPGRTTRAPSVKARPRQQENQ